MNKAKKGDLIRIVNAEKGYPYTNGDILEVTQETTFTGDVLVKVLGVDKEIYVEESEYEIYRKADEAYDLESVAVVSGVGPDAPIVENEFGAKQSKSPYRMDLIDAKALLEIAKVHSQGAEKYGDTNWRNISIEDNLNHALVHVYAYLAGDKQDAHLSHAATRMIFALALDLAKNNDVSAK